MGDCFPSYSSLLPPIRFVLLVVPCVPCFALLVSRFIHLVKEFFVTLVGISWFRGHDSSVMRSGNNYRRESRRLPRLVLRRLALPRDLPVVRRLLTGLILGSNQGRSPGSQ
jgi:hypothetical protein